MARAFQGAGGALLVPGSLALLSASFPESERGRAIGTWSGFTSMTAALGPVLGGWVVEHGSWRWVFLINLPIALTVIVIALLAVPESRNESAVRKLDWAGAILATIGLGATTFALIEAPHRDSGVQAAAVLGIISLAVFILVEARSASPMVPLSLFRSRTFTAGNLLTLFLYAALGGILFFFPLNLIQVHQYSATAAGAALLPFILLMFLLSRWSGGLITRFGPRVPLTVGPLIASAGFVLFVRADQGGSYWMTFFPAVVVLGLGMAVTVAPLTTSVMNSVSRSQAGTASGINNAISRVAGLLAVALFGLVLYSAFGRSMDQKLDELHVTGPERQMIDAQRPRLAATRTDHAEIQQAIHTSFLAGYHVILWMATGLAIASSMSPFLLMRSDEKPATKKQVA